MNTETSFKKASFCHTATCCVEVARPMHPQSPILVRHSVTPDVQLQFTRQEWQAFLLGVKNGEFDLL